MKLPMLSNSKGKSSASFTMLWITFNLLALWLALYVMGPSIGVVVPEFNFDGSTAFLGALAALYFGGNVRKGIQDKDEES